MRRIQLDDNGDLVASYERKLIGGLNRWYMFDNNYIKTVTAGATSSANIIRYYHIKPPRPVTINGVSISISTSITGNFRCGIYDMTVIDNAFRPNNLIIDCGEQSSSGTGYKTFSITPTNLESTDYFLATLSSAATGYQGFVNSATMADIFGVASPTGNAVSAFTESYTYAPLPATANPTGEDTRYVAALFRVTGFL
ncbi:hypothetical protein ELBI_93 [Anabaena phage Elbi]|nr:hypothetical protein ELBI_93 [Anabaena phage Elbi]